MSEFFVGQKVVCVHAAPDHDLCPWPVNPRATMDGLKKGAVYTVEDLPIEHQVPTLVVSEIERQNIGTRIYCRGFHRARFRPLESKAISLFRKIARDVTEGRKVEFVE